MHNTLVLAETDGQTTATLTVRPVGEDEIEARVFRESIPDMNTGFGETFDQLAALLAGPEPAPGA